MYSTHIPDHKKFNTSSIVFSTQKSDQNIISWCWNIFHENYQNSKLCNYLCHQHNISKFLKIISYLFFRISYCSADAAHDHVFAFIATNSNETMECHAFLCPKRKMVSENKFDYKVTIYTINILYFKRFSIRCTWWLDRGYAIFLLNILFFGF